MAMIAIRGRTEDRTPDPGGFIPPDRWAVYKPNMYLLGELSEHLPGMRLRVEGTAIRGLVQQDDAFFAARIRTEPVAELFLATRPTDGFELRIAWGKRIETIATGDRDFDKQFTVDTNDVTLARTWLDAAARAALIASTYGFTTEDLSTSDLMGIDPSSPHYEPLPVQRRTWTYDLSQDELAVIKGSIEHQAERFATAITTAAIVAARSRRWAAGYAKLAPKLDAHASTELELGGTPILSATRHAVDVTVQLLRKVGKHERLRTKISAARIGIAGDSMVLTEHELTKAVCPPLPRVTKRASELAGYRLASSTRDVSRLDAIAKNLVLTARPGAVVMSAHDVVAWFDGALEDVARLDAAIELVARWAVDGVVAGGPYR